MQVGSGNRTYSLALNASQETCRFYAGLLKVIWVDVQADNCLDLAAQMSFYFVLSLFPFLLVIASVIGWLPSTNLWHEFAQWITQYLPRDTRELAFSTILGLTRGYSGFLSFGLFGTLWAASCGFSNLMGSLNIVYGVRETRGFWRRRAIAICATGLSAIFFIASFGLLTFGHWAMLSLAIKWNSLLQILCDISRWLATLLLMCLALDLMNHFLPDITRRWRWLTPGRLFVALMFVAASIGFDFYLRYFANYPRVYGALAGFIILMVWIYIASLILLIGAETDNAMERLKERGESA
jgi:membrane protein